MMVNAPVATAMAPGLPADVRARFLDPGTDFRAVAAFIGDVNIADRYTEVLTADEVAAEWRRKPGFDPARDALVVEDAGGIAAVIKVDAQPRIGKVSHWIEGWVRPDRRREGIGRSLLRWAEQHAAELVRRREVPGWELSQVIGFGVLESNPAAVAFAAASGYAPIRYGFEMRRQLDEPIPDIALPPGIELRPVREADHRKIWEADAEAFQDHWEPRVRNEGDFEGMFTFPGLDTSLWRVAWDADQVVGSVMSSIFDEENARIGLKVGWLEHVSVRASWRGRGVAKALIAASMRALRERGMELAALGVDAQNPTGALGLYEGLGFRPHQKWISHRKPLDVTAPGADAVR